MEQNKKNDIYTNIHRLQWNAEKQIQIQTNVPQQVQQLYLVFTSSDNRESALYAHCLSMDVIDSNIKKKGAGYAKGTSILALDFPTITVNQFQCFKVYNLIAYPHCVNKVAWTGVFVFGSGLGWVVNNNNVVYNNCCK